MTHDEQDTEGEKRDERDEEGTARGQRSGEGEAEGKLPSTPASYATEVLIAEAASPDDIPTEIPPRTEPAESEARPVSGKDPARLAKKA